MAGTYRFTLQVEGCGDAVSWAIWRAAPCFLDTLGLPQGWKPCPDSKHTIRCWAGPHHCNIAWREEETQFEGNNEPCSDSIALLPDRWDRCDVAGISGTRAGSMDGRCPCLPQRG